MLKVENLARYFGGIKAVDGIDLKGKTCSHFSMIMVFLS